MLLKKLIRILLNALIYAVYFIGCCVVVMLVEAMVLFLVDKFVELPYATLTVIRIVIYSAGVPALVGFLGYREGYREAEAAPASTALSALLATAVPHLLFAMLFHYQGFVSGAVRFTAGVLHNGMAITHDSLINQTPYRLFVLVFLGYGLVYSGVLVACRYCGAARRHRDRAEMGMTDAQPARDASDEPFRQ